MPRSKLLIQPKFDDDDNLQSEVDWPIPERAERSGGVMRQILMGLVVGGGLGVLAFLSLSPKRVYETKTTVSIVCDSPEQAQQALGRHLLAIELRRPVWATFGEEQDRDDLPWVTLANDSGVRCSGRAEPPGIVLSAVGPSDISKEMNRLQQDYIGRFNLYRDGLVADVESQRQEMEDRRKALRNQLNQCSEEISSLLEQLGTDELPLAMQWAIDRVKASQDRGRALHDNLTALTAQLEQARKEAVSPVVHLQPDALHEACMADKHFATDAQALAERHTVYMNNLREQIGGVSQEIDTLRLGLQQVSATIAKQLEVDLHEQLADDLLGLRVACELYEKRLVAFEKLWTSRVQQVEKIMKEPLDADIDEAQSVLSEAQGLFEKDCGDLGTRLGQLYKQLVQPTTQSQAGALAKLTVRSVVGSAISPEFDPILQRFEQLKWYLQRACGENNVDMLTTGRVIRSLQARVKERKEQVRERFYKQTWELARQEARARTVTLQGQIQQVTEDFSVHMDKTLELQEKTLALFEAYPQWGALTDEARQLQREIIHIGQQITSLDEDNQVASETLEAGKIHSKVIHQEQAPLPLRTALAVVIGIGGFAIGLFASRAIFR